MTNLPTGKEETATAQPGDDEKFVKTFHPEAFTCYHGQFGETEVWSTPSGGDFLGSAVGRWGSEPAAWAGAAYRIREQEKLNCGDPSSPPLEPAAPTIATDSAALKIHADVLAYDVEILLSYLSVEDKKLWGVLKIQQELDAYMKFREAGR